MRKVILLWLASLSIVGMATLAVAQQRFAEPRILSGNDLGFRVEGTDISGKPMGTLMLRVNGEWVEVGATIRTLPVK